MNISVIGLGKLGLCTATCFAKYGNFKTYIYDCDIEVINSLKDKKCHINETNLENIFLSAQKNMIVCNSYEDIVKKSDITFIVVPTPSKDDGKFSNSYIISVLEQLSQCIKNKNKFHVIAVVSTIMPGSIQNEFIPLLEKISGKKNGINFDVVYNPEFVALGSIIHDFLNPDMILIGTDNEMSKNIIVDIYKKTCRNKPKFNIMSTTSAEITKLLLNCYITIKISFANDVASMCEKIKGAEIDKITEAIGSDSRIGSKYLRAGIGWGGTCFPRDNVALKAFSEDIGSGGTFIESVMDVNEKIIERVISIIKNSDINLNSKISVWGLSYKPHTHIVEESQSIDIIKKLIYMGYNNIHVFDPQAIESSKQVLGDSVKYHDNPYSSAKDSELILILTNWPDFEKYNWDVIAKDVEEKCVLIDCWRCIKITSDKFVYRALGEQNGKNKV